MQVEITEKQETSSTAERSVSDEERLLTRLLVHAEKQEWYAIHDILRRREIRLLANLVMLASTDEWDRLAHLLRLHERALIVKVEGPDRLAVAQLGISTRSANSLERVDIFTVAELVQRSPGWLKQNVGNFGDCMLDELVDALAAIGLALAADPPDIMHRAPESLIQERPKRGRPPKGVDNSGKLLSAFIEGEHITRRQLGKRCELSSKTLAAHLAALVSRGLVRRVDHGIYALADDGGAA